MGGDKFQSRLRKKEGLIYSQRAFPHHMGTDTECSKTKSAIFHCLFTVALISLGFYFGTAHDRYWPPPHSPPKHPSSLRLPDRHLKKHTAQNTLTNPLLECGEINNIPNNVIKKLKSNIQAFIDQNTADKQPDVISVYFRDLNNGPTFGINEQATFIPGSLLKVPFMLGIYKLAESDSDMLKKKIQYDGGHAAAIENFVSTNHIRKGSAYTVDELIEYMIRYSDNDATLLLAQLFPPEYMESIYTDLAIETPHDEAYQMSVKTYASFFRILYNATYMNDMLSEKALRYLTKTDFTQGLTAPLPPSRIVAHKFGERELPELGQKQLHDCGITYYPGKPYVLCVMTRGNDYDKLTDIIRDISKIVYDGVASENPGSPPLMNFPREKRHSPSSTN